VRLSRRGRSLYENAALGLVIGRDKGPDAGTNARIKLEELVMEEGLLKVTAT